MRFITEQELRDAFASGVPEHYAPPGGARLTPAARQYLMDLRLLVPQGRNQNEKPPKPGDKPEDMTHLSAAELVRKDHPRIALRGKLDSLEADILLLQIEAARLQSPAMAGRLGEALDLVRRMIATDFQQAPLGEWTLDGMTPAEVRAASHNPRRYLPEGHVPPRAEHGELAARLNRLRTSAREAELHAVAAYAPPYAAGCQERILALNRLSSYFYVLQLQAIAASGEG